MATHVIFRYVDDFLRMFPHSVLATVIRDCTDYKRDVEGKYAADCDATGEKKCEAEYNTGHSRDTEYCPDVGCPQTFAEREQDIYTELTRLGIDDVQITDDCTEITLPVEDSYSRNVIVKWNTWYEAQKKSNTILSTGITEEEAKWLCCPEITGWDKYHGKPLDNAIQLFTQIPDVKVFQYKVIDFPYLPELFRMYECVRHSTVSASDYPVQIRFANNRIVSIVTHYPYVYIASGPYVYESLMTTGHLVRIFQQMYFTELYSICVSPNGKYLFATHNTKYGSISQWSTENGTMLRTLSPSRVYVNRDLHLQDVRVSSDNKYVFASGYGIVFKWSVDIGELVNVFEDLYGDGRNMALSPDSKYLFLCSLCRLIQRDAETGETIRTLEDHKKQILRVVTSPDGKYLFSGSEDETIRQWDVQSGESIRILRGQRGPVRSLVISPDGEYLFSGTEDRTVQQWEIRSGKIVHTLRDHGDIVISLAVSPDGKYLFTNADDRVYKWLIGPQKQ